MKKITKSLLIALPLLTVAGTLTSCGANMPEDVFTNPGKANDIVRSITVSSDDAVVVTVANSATSGTRVDVNLAFNAEEYKVTDVLVNGDKAVKNSDTSYSFAMPNADVVLTVRGEYVDPLHGKHTITNVEVEKGVVLVGLPSHAKTGEELAFKVQFAWDSAYSFNDKVEVYTVNSQGEKDQDVAVSSLAGVHTFTMPDGDIAVKVGTVAKRFSYTRNTATTSNIQGTKTSTDNWETEDSVYGDLIVTAGTMFKVTLKDTVPLRATGIKLETNAGEVTYNANESKVVEFTMPASDVIMTVIGEINYKTITVEETEHLTIELLEKTTENDEVVYTPVADLEHFMPSSTVYIKVTSNNENYDVTSVSVRYGTTSASPSAVTGQTNMWSFTMPNADDVVVSATEAELIYNDYPFVGKYFGNNLYGENKCVSAQACVTGYTVNIDPLGNFVKGSANPKIITSATQKTGDGVGTFNDNNDFCYGDEFIFGYYALNKKLDDAYGLDYLVSVKAVNPKTDVYTDYSFNYLIPSGKPFIAVEALYKGVVFGKMFFDAVNKKFYDTGVSFEFTAGESVADTGAVFNVKVGDAVVGTVANGAFTLTQED